MKDEVSRGLVRRLDTAEARSAELEDLARETIKAARPGEQRPGDKNRIPKNCGQGPKKWHNQEQERKEQKQDLKRS